MVVGCKFFLRNSHFKVDYVWLLGFLVDWGLLVWVFFPVRGSTTFYTVQVCGRCFMLGDSSQRDAPLGFPP